jgi:hypothetical protein
VGQNDGNVVTLSVLSNNSLLSPVKKSTTSISYWLYLWNRPFQGGNYPNVADMTEEQCVQICYLITNVNNTVPETTHLNQFHFLSNMSSKNWGKDLTIVLPIFNRVKTLTLSVTSDINKAGKKAINSGIPTDIHN